MRSRWTFGDPVRLTRNVRDDGTYPGAKPGDLVRAGQTVIAILKPPKDRDEPWPLPLS